MDSPGVVLSSSVGPLATIQNAVKLDSLEDPIRPIELIMEHCGVEELAQHYQIQPFSTAHELTALLAFRFGKLVAGGVPDTQAAARLLLKDWSNGSVQFYTKPPQVSSILWDKIILRDARVYFVDSSLNFIEVNQFCARALNQHGCIQLQKTKYIKCIIF